jgi:uncharacterized protein YcgI (DUF1989 family)
MLRETKLVPGGEARSLKVSKNEYIKVIDVEGKQVADFIALRPDLEGEYLSTAHTRAMLGKISPGEGDILYSNYRGSMLLLVEDKVGVHDTLFPCCDPMRYKLDYGIESHRNCRDNFVHAFREMNLGYSQVPDPLNLFQNTPLKQDGSFGEALEPVSKPGDYVIFQALMDLVIGISACPQDQTPLNGWKITDIRAEVYTDRSW